MAEKKSIIVSGKRKATPKVPNLRFPGFEGEWEVQRLGNLLEFKNGINASKEQYGKGIKFINVLDILNNDYITYENILGKVDVDNTMVERYPVQYGDILFQRSSETREEVGTANVYLDRGKIATFGGFVIRGKAIGDYEPVFLNKLLKTKTARESITSKSGGSTRYNVGQETLSSIELCFPALTEQKKIATFLTLIDERIATQNKIIWELESFIKGLSERLFSQQLCFKDKKGNAFPSWKIKKLGDVGEFYSGGTPLTSKREYFDGNIPFIRSGEINSVKTAQFISESGLNNSSAKMVEVGDILFALYGATSGEVGISKIRGAINQAVLCIKSEQNHYFIYLYLFHKKESIVKTFLQGGQGNLSAEIVKQIEVPLPTLQEQTLISKLLFILNNKKDVELALHSKYQSQKKFLLQKLFI